MMKFRGKFFLIKTCLSLGLPNVQIVFFTVAGRQTPDRKYARTCLCVRLDWVPHEMSESIKSVQ